MQRFALIWGQIRRIMFYSYRCAKKGLKESSSGDCDTSGADRTEITSTIGQVWVNLLWNLLFWLGQKWIFLFPTLFFWTASLYFLFGNDSLWLFFFYFGAKCKRTKKWRFKALDQKETPVFWETRSWRLHKRLKNQHELFSGLNSEPINKAKHPA